MTRLTWLGVLLALGCGRLSTPDRAPDEGPREATLFVFSDLRGTLKPCGCSPDLRRGGVDRVAEVLRLARASAAGAPVLHAGDLLLDDEGIPDFLRPQIDAKTTAGGEALRFMGVAAATVGPSDLQQPEWLAKALPGVGIPIIVTNPPPTAPWVAGTRRSIVLDVRGVKVGVLGLIPEASGGSPPGPAARAEADALRQGGAVLIVALSSLGLRGAKRTLREGLGVDVLVAAGQGLDAIVSDEVEPLGPGGAPTYLVQSFVQGGQVGRLEVVMTGGPLAAEFPGEPAPKGSSTLRWSLTPVGWDLPREPTIASLMDRFDADLEQINMATASDPVPPAAGEAGYVGVEKCLECHEETRAFWEKDRHHDAWETIVEDKKTFDIYCVSCHVTGFMRPGGSSIKKLDGLHDVQCESCHGPGSLHAESSEAAHIQREVPESTCRTCHNPKHSTRFDYDAYKKRLLVPGHGLGD